MIFPLENARAATVKKGQRRPRLTGRDQRILALLGEYGCVAGARIKACLWNSSPSSGAHYRRLRILIKLRLVEKVLGDRSIPIGYRLTKMGMEALGKIPGAKAPLPYRRAYKTQFEHDQLLIDVRRILQASPLIRAFKTENEIRHLLFNGQEKLLHWENAPLVPDAMFTFSVPGKTMQIALELELSAKAGRRYTRIFRSHLLASDWGLTIYIVKGEKFRARLMELLTDVKAKDLEVRMAKTINGIYFCSLEEFLLKELSTTMTNGKKEFSFTDLAQTAEAKT